MSDFMPMHHLAEQYMSEPYMFISYYNFAYFLSTFRSSAFNWTSAKSSIITRQSQTDKRF